MKIFSYVPTVLLLILAAMPAAAISSATSEPGVRCTNEVRECVIRAKDSQDRCFLEASTNPVCANNPLATLSAKRWAMTPSRPSGLEAAPAFLGPQLIDQACLENFDLELSSTLLRGEPSSDTVKQLEAKLLGCKRTVPNNIFRP